MPTKNKPKLLDYMEDLPGETLLNSDEVRKIFGYSTTISVNSAIRNGLIPKPDTVFVNNNANLARKITRNYWKLSTISELIKNDR